MKLDNASPIRTVEELEDRLSEPTPQVIETLGRLEGDILVLGVGGKMGPTLARMAIRATREAGTRRRVIGVSRFSDRSLVQRLNNWGIETISADLLNDRQVAELPECANVVSMSGMKFGSTGAEALTWAMNTFLAGIVSKKFNRSKIVAFGTGNIYPLSPVVLGGARESDSTAPIGEYAQSCLGRERMYEHFSRTQQTPMSIVRLNYANELRYGVIVDIAQQVWNGQPIDVTMGNFNAVWQGDANAAALASFAQVASPPFVFNLAGPEILSVRRVAEQLAAAMGKTAEFVGNEASTALISNGQLGHQLYGYPRVSIQQLIEWIAHWVSQGGHSLGKPTHFETRDGKY